MKSPLTLTLPLRGGRDACLPVGRGGGRPFIFFSNNEVYSVDGAIIYLCKDDVKLFLGNPHDRKEWKGIVCLLVGLSVVGIELRRAQS